MSSRIRSSRLLASLRSSAEAGARMICLDFSFWSRFLVEVCEELSSLGLLWSAKQLFKSGTYHFWRSLGDTALMSILVNSMPCGRRSSVTFLTSGVWTGSGKFCDWLSISARLSKDPSKFLHPVHLQFWLQRIPDWKHSQYFLRQPLFLQEQPFTWCWVLSFFSSCGC